LASLRGLQKLKVLSINNNRFSDEAIPLFTVLTSLTRLEISNTGITSDGITELRTALPHTTIQGQRGDGKPSR
jgi:hypothetical protein